MKSKVVAALVTLGVIVSSCGDGRLSVDEYYAEASTASAVYEQLSDENFDIYQAVVDDALLDFGVRTAGADTPTLVEETALLLEITTRELSAAFEQSGEDLGDFATTLGELVPPSSVEAAHDAAIAALQRSHAAIPDLVTAIRGASALQEIGGLITASTFGDTRPRVRATCIALETMAVGLGVTADLRCGESESQDPTE